MRTAAMRPGWVRPCTCGKVPRGVYCEECRAFGDGFSGGTWERPALSPTVSDSAETVEDETAAPFLSELTVVPFTAVPSYCPGGHRGATIRGNAAYCAECGRRIPPTASSSYSHGTGH